MINFWLSMRYFAFFFTWGVFLPYWTVWLVEGKHFSVEEAGMIVGTGLVFRALSSMYVFPYACRRISMYHLTWLFPFISTVIVIFFIPVQSFESMILLMILFNLCYPVLLPMNETISTLLSKEHTIHYGRSRSWGSVGFIASLLTVGFLTKSYGDDVIIIIMITGCMFIYLSSVFRTPTALKKTTGKERKSFSLLFKSPNFIWVLMICVMLQGSHAAYYNYGAIYLENLHIDKVLVSVILMLAVVAEVAFFAFSNTLFKRSTVYFMFVLASVASITRWVLVFLFNNPGIFIGSQILHAFTFGLAHYAFIRYVTEEISEDLMPLAQGMYAALAMSLSTGILTLVSGYLYAAGPELPFLGMALITAPALLISGMLMIQGGKTNLIRRGRMKSEF
ncbi:3-phenylpropionate MFS transporter [Rossellomorea aquimaris]|nr:3-phenylpropionate MFS transporter [Rossellomorea aquimaris]